MDYNELDSFLNSVDIPEIKTKPKTFLGIARQPHYENVLSNLYAFYFDVNEEHGLKDLFIASLSQLIEESEIGKGKEIVFDDGFDIETESATNDGGRIDLLLSNDSHAIIIENKVYHGLINDLDDYWESIESSLEENKIGIVLSLYKIKQINHPHFINITHLDFFKCVMVNSGKYLLNANDKYLVYLKDLYQNIINLSTNTMEKKDLEFYFDNNQKINELLELNDSIRIHIAEEVEKGIGLLDYEFYIARRSECDTRRFISTKCDKLSIMISTEHLYTNVNAIGILVEVKGDAINACENLKKEYFTKEEFESSMDIDYKGRDDEGVFQLAGQWEYPITTEQISNLSQFIVDTIEKDHLLPIFNKLEDFFVKEEAKEELVEIA
ncbi:PD-(D/E)XK nuclease family protein [Labilibaculum antarcticum]|uniref:PD-(D/E)XK nuclease superfamily protein n=1 Tax=Labilibaculum antarcticum TaxID=1717717 RepID=A0A1Y1CQZ4_9BACT|nr:PD-(D/E)XK nuclease family protein [Labilibaculum antarcticum]BAX82362.1 hypothetical protein ALGA_4071 [Labilibaculum antarcticum]